MSPTDPADAGSQSDSPHATAVAQVNAALAKWLKWQESGLPDRPVVTRDDLATAIDLAHTFLALAKQMPEGAAHFEKGSQAAAQLDDCWDQLAYYMALTTRVRTPDVPPSIDPAEAMRIERLVASAPSWFTGPLPGARDMSDPLQAYYAEVRAVENEWFKRTYLHGGSRVLGSSLWTDNLPKLRKIDEKHGVKPDDARIYSIAAYLAERRSIEDQWAKLCAEKGWNRPELAGREYSAFCLAESRLRAMLDDCKARHFPGLHDLHPSTIDTIPKLWAHVVLFLTVVAERSHHINPEPAGRRPETCDRDV